MKTRQALAFFAALFASASLMASAPVVSDVVMAQSRGGGKVTVDYTIDLPAIVTLDVQTNVDLKASANAVDGWVSVGDIHLRSVSGDVNRLVQDGDRRILWHPDKDWPEGGKIPNVRAVVTAWATNSPPDYVVIDLQKPYGVRYYVSPEAFPEGNCTSRVYKTDKLVMRRIPAAGVEWMMGSPSGEYGRENVNTSAKETRHAVTLDEDFYIGIFPVTRKQFTWFLSTTPPAAADETFQARESAYLSYDSIRGSVSDGVDWPNTGIETVGANSLLKKIRDRHGFAFDIPTEAQWEYACRAGSGSSLNIGVSPTDKSTPSLAEYRMVVGHARNVKDVEVGTTVPNAWGIYDMHGTEARTWCRDWFTADLGSDDDHVGNGPASGTARVLRGPCFGSYDNEIRSANRHKSGCAPNRSNTGSYTGDIGMRLWLPVTLYHMGE